MEVPACVQAPPRISNGLTQQEIGQRGPQMSSMPETPLLDRASSGPTATQSALSLAVNTPPAASGLNRLAKETPTPNRLSPRKVPALRGERAAGFLGAAMSAASAYSNLMCISDDANDAEKKQECTVGAAGDGMGLIPHPIAQGGSVAIGLQQAGDATRPKGQKASDKVADAMVRTREGILEWCGESPGCEFLGHTGAGFIGVGGSLYEGVSNYGRALGSFFTGGSSKAAPNSGPVNPSSLRTEMSKPEIERHNRRYDRAGTGATLYDPITRSAIRK